MVIGSALGSDLISCLQAEVKVVRSGIVVPPSINALIASISRARATAWLTICPDHPASSAVEHELYFPWLDARNHTVSAA